MLARREVGFCVAWAYVLAGVRAARCRRCRREDLLVPVLLHGPEPAWLARLLEALDRLVGLARVELTFDDGRRSVADCVRVLERFNLPATVFISPGEILRGYNWAERAPTCGLRDFSALCRMDAAAREAALRAAGCPERADDLLTVGQIRALAAHPLVTFGNHTWSHMSCACRPADEALAEIDRAQAQIADWTGRAPTAFSYPFGHDTPALAAALRARGLVPYALRPGFVTPETRGRARNMAYEEFTLAENLGRLLTAWPPVRRMPV